MDESRASPHLRELGVHPQKATEIEFIHQKHRSYLYRIHWSGKSFILKLFENDPEVTEIQSYALLERLRVPTLPVYGHTQKALLLEDLATSPSWRLAKEDDMARLETGVAIAKWYQRLHSTGRKLLGEKDETPSFLKREVDELNPYAIEDIGKKLGLTHDPVWKLAAENI